MILVTAKLSKKHQDRLANEFPEQRFIYGTDDTWQEHIADAEIVVTYGDDITATFIRDAVKLKWIMVISAGIDKLPAQMIMERNILVTNVRGIHKIPMAEYALSELMQVYRQERQLMINQQNHIWDQSVRVNEISGKTMLIVGAGAIGQELARLAKAFGMKTIGISKSGRKLEYFDENAVVEKIWDYLPEADFLVSILPSTAETTHFYTIDHFRKLPEHAVFLNMGRGTAVGTDVLVKAMEEREIAHAVLDVVEEEPLSPESLLWDMEDVTITPHLSGHSPHYVKRAMDIFAENLQTYLHNGEQLINQVDLTRGY